MSLQDSGAGSTGKLYAVIVTTQSRMGGGLKAVI